MIIVNEGWKKVYLPYDGNTAVGYVDENDQLQAVLPLYMDEYLLDKMKKLATYQSPVYIPSDVYALEKTLRELYQNMVDAFICKETITAMGELKILNGDLLEKLENYSDLILKKANGELEEWASLHRLWMGEEYRGMKYHGANPYNMYPSQAYSTPDMLDRCWPERNNIQSIAFGRSAFNIVCISEGFVGKNRIKEESEKYNKPGNSR